MQTKPQLTIIQRTPSTVDVVYGERALSWDVSLLANTSHRKNEFDIFEQINNYWKTQDEQYQSTMFELYRRAWCELEEGGDIDSLTIRLQPIVRQMSSMLDVEQIATWVHICGEVFISPTLMRDFGERGMAERLMSAGTHDMTYLREDYIRLLGLATAIRALVPIFGDFVNNVQVAAGVPYKEHRTGKLLEGTSIEASAAYQKLTTYVNAIINSTRTSAAPILAGLSSEEFPRWVLYMIIIRRLTVGNIKGDPTNPNSHLVTYTHFYLRQRLLAPDGVFPAGNVRNKDIGSANVSDEIQLSILEVYKAPTAHTPGDYAQMRFYAQDPDWILQTLCPAVPRALFDQALEAMEFMKGPVPFYKPQTILVMNLIGPYVAPDVLEHIERLPSLNLYAAVQAMLWYHGYQDLAAFITATPREQNGMMFATSNVARLNIPRSMTEKIKELYPHLKLTSSRSINSKIEPTPLTTIKNLTELMSEHEWVLNLHPVWFEERSTQGISASNVKYWRMPPNIRIQLAKLFIQIGLYETPFDPASLEDFNSYQF